MDQAAVDEVAKLFVQARNTGAIVVMGDPAIGVLQQWAAKP